MPNIPLMICEAEPNSPRRKWVQMAPPRNPVTSIAPNTAVLRNHVEHGANQDDAANDRGEVIGESGQLHVFCEDLGRENIHTGVDK